VTALSEDTQLVLATAECTHELLPLVGGKAVGLGSLLRAGMPVPASFVATSAAFAGYVRSEPRSIPADARDLVAAGYRSLCEGLDEDVPVAVRSSATVEDSTDASCAGQFRTYLGATGVSEVVREVEQCWESAFAPHVGKYRERREIDVDDTGVAVVVQELVHARAAGVMFTQHPRTGDRSLVVIEASYGLGEAVVGGEVTPDLVEVNKVTGAVHERVVGSKSVEHVLSGDGRQVHTLPVSPQRQGEWAITDAEVAELLAIGRRLEKVLGRGLDIEWAIGTTSTSPDAEQLYALQVRPITVSHKPGAATKAGGTAIDLIVGRLSDSTAGAGA
jgi:pyruvate, water dikinase